ncbi:MAG: hypothetical protein WBP13_12600 [Methylophilaceae bacterium]
MSISLNRFFTIVATASLFICFSNVAAAGEFDGSWVLADSDGKPFDATFSKNGTASGTHGDAMKHGTWAVENGAAVIHWTTGWTTRIEKHGDKYVKTAFKPGASLTGKPTNTSTATKKK